MDYWTFEGFFQTFRGAGRVKFGGQVRPTPFYRPLMNIFSVRK